MTIKENEIYPKLEFRLSVQDMSAIEAQVTELLKKFNMGNHGTKFPGTVTNGCLLTAALKRGLRELAETKKLSD